MSSRADHQDVAELLPWYVNGTLEGPELETVERHLEDCPACRTQHDEQSRLAHLLRTSEELAFSADRGLEKMRRRLDEEARLEREAAEAVTLTLPSRLRRGFAELATPVRWAMAAQLIAIVALGGALLRQEPAGPVTEPAPFQTLTAPAPGATGEAGRLRVVFDAEATEGDLRALLIESSATIVAGPSAFGVYTLEIAPAGDTTEVLEVLRSSGRVIFAEALAPAE